MTSSIHELTVEIFYSIISCHHIPHTGDNNTLYSIIRNMIHNELLQYMQHLFDWFKKNIIQQLTYYQLRCLGSSLGQLVKLEGPEIFSSKDSGRHEDMFLKSMGRRTIVQTYGSSFDVDCGDKGSHHTCDR